MSYRLRGLEASLEPWADQEPDSDRVAAVSAWLMALFDDPLDIAGASRLPHELVVLSAEVPDQGVGVGWIVIGDVVVIGQLRDLRTGRQWGTL
jgi:hypothetical protein